MKKPGKAIKKIDKKAPVKSKKEKTIVKQLSETFKISEDALVESTGFGKDGADIVVYAILKTLIPEGGDTKQTIKKINRFLSAMAELNPLDGFEGILISQLICTYKNAMDCFRIANSNKNIDDLFFKLQNQGIKLMRLYNQQLETLDKHRNKGRQKMTVEHVHVYKGGQAIVGEVTQGGKGVTIEN